MPRPLDPVRLTLDEIVRIAGTHKIPDRHGQWNDACDTTCLNEVGFIAKKLLEQLKPIK